MLEFIYKMSFFQPICRYCLAHYKPSNHRVIIECSHEFCQNCIKFLKGYEFFRCPLCYQESMCISNYKESSVSYCIIHNQAHTHFNTKDLKTVCEKCLKSSSNIVPYSQMTEILDIMLTKKQQKLKRNLNKLKTFKENLIQFKLVLNSNQICSEIQEFDMDLDDIEQKIQLIKGSDLIKFCEAFKKFFENPENINEQYIHNVIYKELEKLLEYVNLLIP